MKFKPLQAIKVIKVLVKIGFQIVRRKGSHVCLKHADGRMTVVPVHAGEEIGRGLLRKIMKEARLEKEKFLELVEEV